MKEKLILLLSSALMIFGCQNDFENSSETAVSLSGKNLDARLVFKDKNSLENALNRLNYGTRLSDLISKTRGESGVGVTDGKRNEIDPEKFISLTEYNKARALASINDVAIGREDADVLTADDLNNFEISDSVIMDDGFAALLNGKREIEVDNKVYKYLKNGVVIADSDHYSEISGIENNLPNESVISNKFIKL